MIEEISDLNVLKDKYITTQIFLRNNGGYGVSINDILITAYDYDEGKIEED